MQRWGIFRIAVWKKIIMLGVVTLRGNRLRGGRRPRIIQGGHTHTVAPMPELGSRHTREGAWNGQNTRRATKGVGSRLRPGAEDDAARWCSGRSASAPSSSGGSGCGTERRPRTRRTAVGRSPRSRGSTGRLLLAAQPRLPRLVLRFARLLHYITLHYRGWSHIPVYLDIRSKDIPTVPVPHSSDREYAQLTTLPTPFLIHF